jgi:hypothetical protein
MCPSACFERDNLLSNARSTHRRLPVNFEAFEWRERHQSSVVEPHVNTPELLHGRIHQSFHLLAIGNTFCSAMAMASAPAMKRRRRRLLARDHDERLGELGRVARLLTVLGLIPCPSDSVALGVVRDERLGVGRRLLSEKLGAETQG